MNLENGIDGRLSENVVLNINRTVDINDYGIPKDIKFDEEKRLLSDYLSITRPEKRFLVIDKKNPVTLEDNQLSINLVYSSLVSSDQVANNKEAVEVVNNAIKGSEFDSYRKIVSDKFAEELDKIEVVKENITQYLEDLDNDNVYNLLLKIIEENAVPNDNQALVGLWNYFMESNDKLLVRFAVMWRVWHMTYLTDKENDLQRWYYQNAFIESKKEDQKYDVEAIIILMQLDHERMSKEYGEDWRNIIFTDFENCDIETYNKYMEMQRHMLVKEFPVSSTEYPEYFRGDLKAGQIVESYNDKDSYHIVEIKDQDTLKELCEHLNMPKDVAIKMVADYKGSRQRIEVVTNQLRYFKKVDIYKDQSKFKDLMFLLYRSSEYTEVSPEEYFEHFGKKEEKELKEMTDTIGAEANLLARKKIPETLKLAKRN